MRRIGRRVSWRDRAAWLCVAAAMIGCPAMGLAQPAGAAEPADARAAESAAWPDASAVNLRPMFQPGRATRYRFWTHRTQQSDTRLGPRQLTNSLVMEAQGEVTWRVLAVRPDGSATCELVYDHVALTLTPSNGQPVTADSRQGGGSDEPMQAFVRAMTGVPLTLEMAADGSAVSVANVQAIRQRISEPERAPHDEDFLQTASDLAVLPGVPATLAVGGQWAMDFDWRHSVGRLGMATQTRLVDVQLMAGIPVATLDTSAELRLVPQLPQGADARQIQVRQVEGSFHKQTFFDLQRHESAGANTLRRLVIQVDMQSPDGSQSIQQRITETLQEQLLRIAEPGEL